MLARPSRRQDPGQAARKLVPPATCRGGSVCLFATACLADAVRFQNPRLHMSSSRSQISLLYWGFLPLERSLGARPRMLSYDSPGSAAHPDCNKRARISVRRESNHFCWDALICTCCILSWV